MFHNNKEPAFKNHYKIMKKFLSVQERKEALRIVLNVRKVLTRVSSVMRSNYYAAREEVKNDGGNIYLFDAYFCEVYDCCNDYINLYEKFIDNYAGTREDVVEMFQDCYGEDVDALPDCLRNAINWDDVISDFICFDCIAVNYNYEAYYFRNV